MAQHTETQVLAAVRKGKSTAQLVTLFGDDLAALSQAAQLLFLNFDYAGALELVKAGAGAHPLADMARTVGLADFVLQVQAAEAAFFRERYLADPHAWWVQRNELQTLLSPVHPTQRAMEGALDAMGYGLTLPGSIEPL